MSSLEEVKAHVEELEAQAEKSGWDQPSLLFRLYPDWHHGGEIAAAIVPLQFLHGHAPTACEMLADMLLQNALPPQVWPKVGEIALCVMNEAWQARPDRGEPKFRAEYDKLVEARLSAEEYDRAVQALYRKHYGERFSFAEIPGSDEIRMVAVLMGKRSLMYTRTRGEEPMWHENRADSEFAAYGRLYDAMVEIQRGSRVATRGKK